MKKGLKNDNIGTLRTIPKSQLDTKNKITVTGALAVPVLRYIFGIINWRREEIEKAEIY